MRRHSEYTRRLCRLYSDSKASASPCLARSIASASESLPCCFFASVKSSFPAASCQMRRKYLFVVLLAGTLVLTSSPARIKTLQQVAAYGLAGHSVRRVSGLVRYRIPLQVLASRFSLIISRFIKRKKGPKNHFGSAFAGRRPLARRTPSSSHAWTFLSHRAFFRHIRIGTVLLKCTPITLVTCSS